MRIRSLFFALLLVLASAGAASAQVRIGVQLGRPYYYAPRPYYGPRYYPPVVVVPPPVYYAPVPRGYYAPRPYYYPRPRYYYGRRW